MKIIFALLTLILLNGCSGNNMKPIDFKDQKPKLIIEDYLSGNVKAWGILQNRSGKVTRQFSADLNGKWDGKQLILDEKFNWNDGEVQTRQWLYVLLVPVKGKEVKIKFDDWIFKQDNRVAINKATMTKFGIKVAELTVMFVKD